MNITLIGGGIAKGDLSLRALNAIKASDFVLVKTEKTQVAEFLKEEGVAYTSLDGVYEKSRSFDTLNKNLVSAVCKKAKEGSVCYVVDGSLAEDRSVKLLLAKHPNCAYLEGVSRVSAVLRGTDDLTYTALSAYDVNESRHYTLPVAVFDIDGKDTAVEVKLQLSRAFGEESEVRMITDGKVRKMRLYEIDRLKEYGISGSVLYLAKPDFFHKEKYDFYDLVHLVELLRAENGCPWDKAQTHESIRRDLLEEAYELVDAIDKEDYDNMEEEAGDVILQSVFHSVMSEEEGVFTAEDVLTRLCKKLIFRHSHVFGEDKTSTAEEALAVWNKNKEKEKTHTTTAQTLTDLPSALPQLLRAEKVKKRSRAVHFDWNTVEDVIAKLKEETREVEDAVAKGNPAEIEEECGDLLLACACVVAHLGLHPELTLKEGIDKYVRRFTEMERLILADGKKLTELNEKEYDDYWRLAKKS